ncbi:divalent-cation tolerance protein CutA [Alteromonadaceae bacterium BrNp21-10]|nr:divalent-cation tolerance protein CutA [Alteromonadaceae bacterium BrNp21-10]
MVLCTCPDAVIAEAIAKNVVEQKLAACANIIPGVKSLYIWEGEVQQQEECQLLMKTRPSECDKMFKLVLSLHPYDVPEWLVIDINDGSEEYLNWINRSLK